MSLFLHLVTETDHRIIDAADVNIIHNLKEGSVSVITANGELIKCDPSIIYGSFAECAAAANSYANDGKHDSFIFPAVLKSEKKLEQR